MGTGGSRLICPPKGKGGGRVVRAKAEVEVGVGGEEVKRAGLTNNKGHRGKDNWGALKGKMLGRSLSVEGGRGKEDVRVLSEFKETKGGVGGIKGSRKSEAKGSQKGQTATCSQSPPERNSTSPRKTRRSQRAPEKGKGEKQEAPSTSCVSSCPLALPDNFDL